MDIDAITGEEARTYRGIARKLGDMLVSGDFSDITITVGEKVVKNFYLHKMILAPSSPVFGAMLTNDFKEKNSNEVIVTDIEPEVYYYL